MEKIVVNAEIDGDKLKDIMNRYGIVRSNKPLSSMNGINAKFHLDNGNILVEAKTIYDIKHKTKQQITDILLEVERRFLQQHPDYRYENYRYEDGKFGERTVMLIFIKK